MTTILFLLATAACGSLMTPADFEANNDNAETTETETTSPT